MPTKIHEIEGRRAIKFLSRYPLVAPEDRPKKPKLSPISYKTDEVGKFDVIFFHRLFKRMYGEPSEVELEDARQREDGRMVGFPGEWKYFIRTGADALIQVSTQDKHTKLAFHVLLPEESEPSAEIMQEGERFITDLLAEAERLRGQILNPKKEFEEGEGIQLYLLHNVYLSNYGAAELLRNEFAEENEQAVRTAALRFDARTEDWADPTKREHVDKYIRGVGMFYAAAISYYFMALEGFVNLIYHAFLKSELRDRHFSLEQRLDLEQKLRLMSYLCSGFKKEDSISDADYWEDFRQLRDHRNQMFHSRIQDSLKEVCLAEQGFLYTCDIKRSDSNLLPSQKGELRADDVLGVKNTVDKIVNHTVRRMDAEPRKLVEEFVLECSEIPFWKDTSGRILLGRLKTQAVR